MSGQQHQLQYIEVIKGVLDSARHVENRAWTSLGHFLVANAFIIAALAEFYDKTPKDAFGGLDWVMALLSALGFLTGLQWALLGSRNWQYAQVYTGWLDTRLKDGDLDPTSRALVAVVVGAKVAVQGKSGNKVPLGYHHVVLTSVPIAMSFIYLCFAAILAFSRGGLAAGLGSIGLVVGAVGIAAVIVCYRNAESRRTEIPVL